MKIEFYGVRGSTPTPGKDTVLFGGNTSCVNVCLNDGNAVILDAGTGIISLGNKLINSTNPITILLTHNHWDHIQGFPFFKPIYQPGRDILIIPGAIDLKDKDMILKQMSGSTHPVKYEQLPANITIEVDRTLNKTFTLSSFMVETQRLNHPDGGSAYCLYGDGKKLAYVTDNELRTPTMPTTSWQQWVEFIADADVLIHDGQYTEHDLPHKFGWGHSVFDDVGRLACEARVKTLFIISHDPERKDDELLIEEKKLQTKYSDRVQIFCARESTVFDLENA